MAQYEVVAHVTRNLPCETAEEAAALVRRQLTAGAGEGGELLHLAVWRRDTSAGGSPLPPSLRQQLVDFFSSLERCAEEAETAFRGRVEAILTSMSQGDSEEPRAREQARSSRHAREADRNEDSLHV